MTAQSTLSRLGVRSPTAALVRAGKVGACVAASRDGPFRSGSSNAIPGSRPPPEVAVDARGPIIESWLQSASAAAACWTNCSFDSVRFMIDNSSVIASTGDA